MQKLPFILILLSSVFFSNCTTAPKKDSLSENGNSYIHKTQNLLDGLDNNLSPDQVIKDAHELISLATPVIQDFQSRHPECLKYLDVVLSFSDVMPNLTLEEIKSQFHEGQVLPDGAEICLIAKDLIVQPATVIILARDHYNDEGKDQIRSELQVALKQAKQL